MKRFFLVLAAWMLQQLPGPAFLGTSVVALPTVRAMAGGVEDSEAMPVYRFWSPVHRKHFYTLDEAEKDKLLGQYPHVWSYEGVAFRALPSGASQNVAPVYRFWSGPLNAHFYTLDDTERDKLITRYPDVWTYEGVAFYAHASGSQPEGTMPIWRFWSGAQQAHFYTASDPERFKLISSYSGIWDYEGIAWYAYCPDATVLPAFRKGPSVHWVTSDSATITWETNVAAPSRVHYEPAGPDGLDVVDPTPVTLHKVVLTGLNPGITYSYTAASGWTHHAGTFKTAPCVEQPFRFVVYGDSRSDPDTHWRVTVGIAQSGPDIVFHTGDMVGSGADYDAWETEFFEPAGGSMRYMPLVPVPGNHEYGGTGPRWFFYYFDRPLDDGWFAMTYGNTRFVGLDTNVAYAPGSPQYEWLVREVQSDAYRSATWHIVIFHHPPFTFTAGHSGEIAIRSQLVPLFEQSGVDVAFSGHSHAYERYLHNGIHYIVTGGGGAPLYALSAETVPPLRQFGLSVYHYCVVSVDPLAGTLGITAVDLDGRVFDTITLSK